MNMNTDHAEHKRDQRLRKRLLQVLNAAKVRPDRGWAGGRFIFDIVDGAIPGGQRFESDEHMLGLMRDLIAGGYVEERDDRVYNWQPTGVDSVSYRVTALGTALVLEAVDPDPLVEDSRLAPARVRGRLPREEERS